jgi:hypothetical protein
MNKNNHLLQQLACFKWIAIAAFILIFCSPALVLAQGDGPRFYWKGLSGTNAIPVIGMSSGGNSNPLDPAHTVIPGSNIEATMANAGYARMFSLFDRAAMLSVLVPMGRISGDLTLNGKAVSQSARGFGDPLFQLGVNIIGPKAMKNIPDHIRYEPGFSMDVIGSLVPPIGEYDDKSPVNIGQNRWRGRIGAPIIVQIGPWVPGKKTTLEFLPAVWFFGDNNNFVGQTLETKPMFQLEGHLTRDFMERVWGSLDFVSYTGGQATIDGVEGEKLSNFGAGATLGYHLNDNIQLTGAYVSSFNDSGPDDLKMDTFRVSLVFAWHPLIEGMKRLKSNE